MQFRIDKNTTQLEAKILKKIRFNIWKGGRIKLKNYKKCDFKIKPLIFEKLSRKA